MRKGENMLNDLDFDWTDGISDDVQRKRLKVNFKMAGLVEKVFFPLGWGTKLQGFKFPSSSTSASQNGNSPASIWPHAKWLILMVTDKNNELMTKKTFYYLRHRLQP